MRVAAQVVRVAMGAAARAVGLAVADKEEGVAMAASWVAA